MSTKPEIIKIDEVEYVRKDSIPSSYMSRKEGVWEVGQCYMVRTVTMHIHGRLVEVTPNELVFVDAAWIADSGRYFDFLSGSTPNEIEPFPNPVIVGRGSIVDATRRDGRFRVQK